MEDKIIIILVGLPARGKSFTSNNLSRFLNWCGINCKVFNSGDYRRKMLSGFQDSDFFNNENFDKREEISKLCFDQLIEWLKNDGNIAIFDATNTNIKRRKYIKDTASNYGINKLIFIELITDDDNIINNNLQLKLISPDYIDKDKNFALEDFKKRLSHYQEVYQTIDDSENLKYIKIINFTEKLLIKNVIGANESLIISYLMNLRLNKNPIYLTRHGESINNEKMVLGGDCSLTDKGLEFSRKLTDFINKDIGDDFIIYTSCLKRTIETVQFFNNKKIETRLLNEIHAGICEGLTQKEILFLFPNVFESRKKNKLRFRYPEGESYMDLLERLRYFVLQIESYNKPILIVAHNAILKVLLGYFNNIKLNKIPHLDIPIHTVFKLTPNSKSYSMDTISL
tara:strand:- start:1900 stop:3093 length:1194 start_codon:yes stop_codon:yes gene_type:complete